MNLSTEQKYLLIDFMAYCSIRNEVAILSRQHESQIGLELVAEYENVLLKYDNENLESYIKEHYLS